MNSNIELFTLIIGLFFGIIIGGLLVYLVLRKRIHQNSDENLKLEFESTRTRLQTELANAAKIIDEKTQINQTKETQIV